MARGTPSFASLDATLFLNATASSLVMLEMPGDVSSPPFAPDKVASTVRLSDFGGVLIRRKADGVVKSLNRR